MIRRLTLLFAISLALATAQDESTPLAFTAVTVVDVRSGQLQPQMTVVIAGGKIMFMGRTGLTKPPRHARVVDGSGKYLIPGLWDMHTHTTPDSRYEYVFPLFVANGVTGVRDMGTNLPAEAFAHIRQEVASGKRIGPRFAAWTGELLTPGHSYKLGRSGKDA